MFLFVVALHCIVAPAALPALDPARFGEVDRRHARFAVTLGEATEEAAQQLECIVSASSAAYRSADLGIQNLTKQRWMLTAFNESRLGTDGFRWHRLADATSGVRGGSSVANAPPRLHRWLQMEGQPALLAPFLGCMLSRSNTHAVAASECWSRLASLASALVLTKKVGDDWAQPSSGLHATSETVSASVAQAINFCATPIAHGIVAVTSTVLHCIEQLTLQHHSFATESARVIHRQAASVHQTIKLHKTQRARLLATLTSERSAAAAAAATAKSVLDQSASRESKLKQSLRSAQDECAQAVGELKSTQSKLSSVELTLEEVRQRVSVLEQRSQELEEENQELRDQARAMGETMAGVVGNAELRGSDAEELRTAYVTRQRSDT